MNITKLDIKLDKKGCTYEPGEEISGHVLIRLESPQKARGLKINIKGECHVQWLRAEAVRDENGIIKTQTKNVTASECHINSTKYLIGREDGPIMKIPAGEQSHPFSFQLPREIPGSLKHDYGNVIYTLKAVVDLPNKTDHEVTKEFTVVSKLDLNAVPVAAERIRNERTVPFCNIFCCSFGEIDVQIRLPVTGYVPGQSIKAKVSFDNKSIVEIVQIKLNLIQIITFQVPSDNEKQEEKRILNTTTLHGPFEQSGEFDMSVLVRSVPASSYYRYCKLISIGYILNVTYVNSDCREEISDNYPILIGTIPLTTAQSERSTASVPVEAANPSAPYLPEPNVPIVPYPSVPKVPIPPYPLEPVMPIPPYPPVPKVPIPPYPPVPKVPIAPYPPGPGVPIAPYPPEPAEQSMPINHQPKPQSYKLGFENYTPEAREPVTGVPFVVPVPGPSTPPIGFVLSPEFPPPSYEECIRSSHPADQKQQPNSDADVKQPLIPPYPLDNHPHKSN